MRRPAEVEAEKFTKQFGGGRNLPFRVPGETDVHAWDVGSHGSQLNALAVERPWPVDHVGEDRDAHSGGDHAAYGFDRGSADNGSRAKTGRLPIARRGFARFIDGEHDIRLLRDVFEPQGPGGQEG